MNITLEEGKYRFDGRWVYRYSEPWRDVTGDKFIGAMADLLESQAARVAELEARYEHWFKEATKARGKLAALRRKIDEAPVVAWVKDGQVRWCNASGEHELVSREDLK